MTTFCGKTFEIAEIQSLARGRVYKLKGAELWDFSEEMFDLDEPTGESDPTMKYLVERAKKIFESVFGEKGESIIKGNLPLIKTNKLLTNIKLD